MLKLETPTQIPVISPKFYFKLSTGQIIKSIKELPIMLDRMDGYTFRKYVTSYKNDFAKWIFDVFRIKDLAVLIGNTKSRQETIRLLRAYLDKSKYSNVQKQENQKQMPTINAQETILKNKVIPKPAEQKSTNAKQETKQETKPQNKKSAETPLIKHGETKQETTMPDNKEDPDEYFRKNPILMSQAIEARKKKLEIIPLNSIVYKGDETVTQLDELFKDTYLKAYERLVFLRKNGFDTAISHVMLFRIPTKIKVFEASKAKKDVIIIKRYLNEVIEELNNVK